MLASNWRVGFGLHKVGTFGTGEGVESAQRADNSLRQRVIHAHSKLAPSFSQLRAGNRASRGPRVRLAVVPVAASSAEGRGGCGGSGGGGVPRQAGAPAARGAPPGVGTSPAAAALEPEPPHGPGMPGQSPRLPGASLSSQ